MMHRDAASVMHKISHKNTANGQCQTDEQDTTSCATDSHLFSASSSATRIDPNLDTILLRSTSTSKSESLS